MKLTDYYNFYKNSNNNRPITLFIVGTGPSNRVFPLQFIEDDPCCVSIGLNNAHRFIRCRFNITIHPHCIPLDCNGQTWFTKIKESDHTWKEHLRRNNPQKWILFNNSDSLNAIVPDAPRLRNTLFCGRGIQTAALHLAAHMGARYAILVGCDMGRLGRDHHAIDQHTQFHTVDYQDVYNEYYYYTAYVRKQLKKEYGMDVLTLSPFLGQKHADQDYEHLCEENGLEPLPLPTEVEFSSRNTDVVKDYIK